MLDALALITRHADAGSLTYYPAGEDVPAHTAMPSDWKPLVFRTPAGRQRVVRMVYEIGTFQALREHLRCKEIWIIGADKWRNPDEDLPADFETRRVEHYAACANRSTRASSSTNSATRCAPSWTPCMTRCPAWTGWRSPSGARATSNSPRSTPHPSRATCGG